MGQYNMESTSECVRFVHEEAIKLCSIKVESTLLYQKIDLDTFPAFISFQLLLSQTTDISK